MVDWRFLVLVALNIIHCQCVANDAELLREFAESNREFSANIYKELAQEEDGNFLVCPLSVTIVMALAGLGAKGATSREISSGLKLSSDSRKTEAMFATVLSQLQGREYYALNLANRLYVKEGDVINQTYKENAERIFKARVENIDFTRNTKAAAIINKFVEDKTNNKIHNLVKPDDLDANTRLILINALHFKAIWKHKFDTFDTITRQFYVDDSDSKSVDMMQITDYFNYYENEELDCKFLEMPYQGDDISMMFVLPNKRNGLKQLEERAQDVFKVQPLNMQQVRVQIPKFTMETTIKFKPILEKLGIQTPFSGNADFSGISSDHLMIDTVLQKTFINVTERGTEAASATSGGVVTLSIPAPPPPDALNFTADHSFLVVLQFNNRVGRLVLFSGRVSSPTAVRPSPPPSRYNKPPSTTYNHRIKYNL